jgi:hypothetical protein
MTPSFGSCRTALCICPEAMECPTGRIRSIRHDSGVDHQFETGDDEEASELLAAVQKAADKYNDESCVEHVEESLAKIAQAG